MVADSFPVDQYYANNPSELFEDSLDDLIIDTDNDVILEGKPSYLIAFKLIISTLMHPSPFTMRRI